MNAEMRRARTLAVLADVLVPMAAADLLALAATAALWFLAPERTEAIAAVWIAAAIGTATAFLLRDARGGRARKWLALEVRGSDGRPPGAWGSVRRNLPLLLPGWNAVEAGPLLRDGAAARPADRAAGWRVVSCD